MTRLTDHQRTALTAAAAHSDGLLSEEAIAKRALTALVKRGLLEETDPRAEDEGAETEDGVKAWLRITEAGRAALDGSSSTKAGIQEEPEALPARATKQDTVLALLRKKDGASLGEIMEATSWQQHWVRDFLSETVKKKLGLETADRSVLCQLWSDTYQTPPPKGWSQAMLRRALATELQGKVFGTLTKAELKQLGSFAPGTASLMPDGEDGRSPASRTGRTAALASSSGTRLIRTWHGKTYEVTMLAGGRARLGDETYRTLSAVATAITGTKWSGPLFFGLRDRKKVEASSRSDGVQQ